MEVGLNKKENMGFEETELRLGLPGNVGGTGTEEVLIRKRGFSETETETEEDESATTVDLMLNLSSKEAATTAAAAADPTDKHKTLPKEKTLLPADPAKPPAK